MEPESSLPYSQVPATCPYPEPAPSSPHNPLPLPEDSSSSSSSSNNNNINNNILKQPDTDELCRRRGKESETIQHITAACEQLAPTEYVET
jgi:hypothetical protein